MATTFLLSDLVIEPVSALFQIPCPSRLVQERADPVVGPGSVATHVRTISRGSYFSFDMDHEDARASKCSLSPIKQDMSAQWSQIVE